MNSLFSFTQKLCTYVWDFNLNTGLSWFCAAHGLPLGSIATPAISDFSFPKAVHLHWESPLNCAGKHAAELMCGIHKQWGTPSFFIEVRTAVFHTQEIYCVKYLLLNGLQMFVNVLDFLTV
jgi:hypothetical protein